MTGAPVLYRPDVEQMHDDESETIQELNSTFDVILERTAEDYGHAVRSVHAKSHGVLEGELTVHAGLPAELAQGVFATPGTHKVMLRLSTNAGDILPDAISLPRGLALKVFDVPGERLPGSEGTAQDFIMINGPVFLAPTAKKFSGNLKMLAKTTDRFEERRKPFLPHCGVFVLPSKRSVRKRRRRSTRWAARPMWSRWARHILVRRRFAMAITSQNSVYGRLHHRWPPSPARRSTSRAARTRFARRFRPKCVA